MNLALDTVRREIDALVDHPLSRYGPLVEIRPIQSRQRAYSNVHRLCLRFEKGDVDVCVKVHRRRHRPFESDCVGWAHEEYRLLEALYAASNVERDGALRVVRPLVFLPRLPGIVLETHPGEVLSSLMRRQRLRLWRRRRALEETGDYYFRCGASLLEMQRLTTADAAMKKVLRELEPWELGPKEVLRDADAGLSKALGLCGSKQRETLARAYASAREVFVSSTRSEVARVGAHGDFTPVNVFVGPSQVTLFDFVNFHMGHPFEDVSRFLAYTVFLGKDPLNYRGCDIAGLMERFMQGYALPDWRKNGVLKFFFQKNLFRTLGGGLRFQEGSWPKRVVYRKAMLRVFRRWVEEGTDWP